MRALEELFKSKPYLAWDVANPGELSQKSMLEHILNYGTWEDYLLAEKALGIKKINLLFKEIMGQKRVNLKPQTINYFSNYLARYA
ncbi:MAG: hypothetical protein ACOYT7_00250 [Patescibacteria group bacterium]